MTQAGFFGLFEAMKQKLIILVILVGIFFFGEIAITFSDRGNSFIVEDEEVAFSLKLENAQSDFPSLEIIDRRVEHFMNHWDITGASVAITKDELVYTKGFGSAVEESGESVKPGHLFRIASVSKLVTAVAIMKLYENGNLSLDEKVFGKDGIIYRNGFHEYKDKRVEQIEVQHLLNHTAGWSRRAGDPMFNSLYIARKMDVPPPASVDQIIQFTLSRKLHYEPGQRYSYSNLGYAILGKIIEVKSGMPYEDYVMMNILKPVGIHDMHIGRSYVHEKYPNEVNYYTAGISRKVYDFSGSGKYVPIHYGGNPIELLGAAGGWIASSPELIKLLTALDGFPEQPDILKPETLTMMTNPNLSGRGLFGWRGSDKQGTWWRTGYFNGTTALLVRQADGINWVILLNTSTYKKSRIHRYLSAMMFESVNRVNQWPDRDLFFVDRYESNSILTMLAKNPKL